MTLEQGMRMKIVPDEATLEMLVAGQKVFHHWYTKVDVSFLIEAIYQAMLAAAPIAEPAPVAWRWHWKFGGNRDREWEMWTYGGAKPIKDADKFIIEPLYAAQPKESSSTDICDACGNPIEPETAGKHKNANCATDPTHDHDFQKHISTQLRMPVRCGTCGAIIDAKATDPTPAGDAQQPGAPKIQLTKLYQDFCDLEKENAALSAKLAAEVKYKKEFERDWLEACDENHELKKRAAKAEREGLAWEARYGHTLSDNLRKSNAATEAIERADKAEAEVRALREALGERDKDWILAMSSALGTDSGLHVPIVPEVEPFKKLFAALRQGGKEE